MQERKVKTSNNVISYYVRTNKRARRLSLTIYPEGKIVLTLPRLVSIRQAEKFVCQKAEWLVRQLAKLEKRKSLIENTKENYLAYKEQARSLAKDRLEYYNQLYKFRVKRVAIRNQRTRWGSCSNKSNLNFNYRLVFLPTDLVDYIIVHELCHLKELNHSIKFWQLVEQTIPDYKLRRSRLRKISLF